MDAFGPRAAFGKVVEVTVSARQSPTQRACSLGASILQDTFKVESGTEFFKYLKFGS